MEGSVRALLETRRGYIRIRRMLLYPYDRVWWKYIIRYLMIAIGVYLGWPGVKSIIIGLWIRMPWDWFVTRFWGSYSFSRIWKLFKEIITEYYTSGPVFFLLSQLGPLQGIATLIMKWMCFNELMVFVGAKLYVYEKEVEEPLE